MRKKFLLMLTLLILALGGGGNLFAQVAKVGNTEYATIDAAIAAWTNNTTLTLLSDVTLTSDVKLKSTEHHILDLGTYTMTAASGKNAIEITCEGRTSASYAITVNADATNPGGITAAGKACIYYSKSGSTKDRPIIRIYNGVFNGSYSINSKSNGNTNCPQIWIYGGTFNGNVNLTKNMLQVYGGTFNGWINCTGDQNAYRLIAGGRFKSWQFMTNDNKNGNYDKFGIATSKENYLNGNYNVGVYIDKEGYLVVGGSVITELCSDYKACVSYDNFKTTNQYNNFYYYLAQSAAAKYGLFYEDVDMAIAKHGEANVTIWEKPAVTIPENVEGDAAVVEEIKNNIALEDYTPENLPEGAELEIVLVSVGETFVYDVTPMANGSEVDPTEAITFRLPVPASVQATIARVYHSDENMGIYEIQGEGNAKYVEISSADFSVFAIEPAAWVDTYEELIEALNKNNALVQLANDITATATQSSGYGKAGIVLDAGDVLDGNGKTLTINGAGATWDCAIAMRGGEVKDLTIAGAMRGVFMPGANGDVVIDNCKFENVIYTFNSDAGSTDYTVTIKNTTLNGWTSFSNVHKTVTFESCTFGEGNGYAFCRPYQATTFVGCAFNEGYEFDTSKAAENSFAFNDCTYNGEALSDENKEMLNMFYNGGSVVIDGEETNVTSVAKIGNNRYLSLEEAAQVAQTGETITMLADATLSEKLTLPAGIILNGNGKQINGEVWADGNLTFVGHTKVTTFNAGYNKPTITIGEGACLELTGTGRMVLGHGATFNITGNITDAKTADKATVQPSLIMAGASFTGAGLTFNVTNAYIKATAYCSTKNSSASNTFDFNIENSIWEQANTLVFSVPTSGKDPIVNFELKKSVLSTTSHLVFGVSKGEIVFDNSIVNEGAYKQLENRSNMTVKNGSVVYATVNTNENSINSGTLTVENATYMAKGNFSGATVGTGTIVVKKGANVTAEKITNANIVIDAAEMTVGELANFTANLSNFAGELSVINNNKLEAQIVDGKIVLVAKPVAKIGEQGYATLEDAFKAATSGCTIDILLDVTVDTKWDCRYTGAKFTVPVTINGNGKTIKFTNTVNDNNWNTVFRFEENATVNNLTVDIAEATGAQRVITAKKNLNVDNLNIVGIANYGIIFGEGASATDLETAEIVVKNSTLWGTRAISDNANGKDVKSVVIDNNTLNGHAYISASESITFNKNTANGEVDLRSYTAENVLSVVAKENTLKEGVKNYIYAKTIDAQEEFTTENPPLKVSNKAELDAALAAAKEGNTITLTADIDYGTTQLAITKAITLDLGGKTLTTRNAWGGMSIKNNPTVKNGNIVHASNTAAIKVWNATAFEDLVIDVQGKGDANKTIGGIVLQEGSTTRVGSIKNVTIKGAALTNGIETYNCGDATANVIGSMENVTIDAVGTGMLISAPCGTATNCDIKGGVNGIEIWIKGNYSASLNLVESTVKGGVFAHDEFNSNPGVVNNGTLSLTADEATTGAGVEDVTLTIARAEENLEGVIKEVMEAAQAKIDNTYYITIAKAIEAAQAGKTVTILAGTYPVPAVKAGITIEGEMVDGKVAVLLEGTLSGTLENLTMKNIRIKGGHAQRWAYAKGNLLFENVTFEATSVYALHFDGITEGTNLTYKDCTIIGWAAMGGSPASCTFDGCTIKGNGTYGVIRTYFDATINNCTFDVANVNDNDNYEDGIHAVDGAYVTVTDCTNKNGNMIDLVNIHALSIVKLDDVEIKHVATVTTKDSTSYYRTLAEAFAAAGDGKNTTVTLLDDIDLAGAEWTPIGTSSNPFKGTFDGQNYTISNLVINGGSNSDQGFFGYTKDGEIKNVTFNNAKVSGYLNVGVVAGTPYTSKYTNVKVTGHVEVNGYAYVGGVGGKNAYANWTDITVDVDPTSYVKADSENYRTYVGGVVGFNGEGGHTFMNISSNIKVKGSTCDIGGVFGIAHYGNKFKNITFTGSVEALAGATEVGGIAGVWHNQKGYTVTFTNCTSTGKVTIGEETTTGSIVGGAYNAANETSENSGSLIIEGKEAWLKVAEVNGVKYLTLAEAAAAAQYGDTIKILDNLTIGSSSLTLPAGITLDGNGKTIDGGITAGGDLTFVGHTKVSTFSAGYYDRTITIGEDACLEVTGGRMTVSYGNTINVTGSIDEAKSANKAEITPSLIIEQGLSFNGDGRGVEFNITNAYVKLGDSSSKNSGATGKFNFNFVNSIVDFTKTLKTYEPTKEGLDPSFEINVENSVVSFASYLELWNTNTALTLNNSNLTVGSSFANAGTINVTNGANFVVNAPIMSSHGGNTGTINIKGGVFELKDSNQDWENAGTIKVNAVGGKLITNDFKCVGEGKIVVDAENLIGTVTVVDGNGVYNFANITEIINGESVNVSYENGDVTVTKVLATIGENEYQDLQEAIEAAGTTETIITIMASFSTDDSYTIAAGQNITLDLNGKTITGTDKTEKSFGLINNKGTLTIVDNSNNRAQGVLKLSATVNSGWNRYSSVISNQPGGKLIVNGGTIEHLGGTDMAYAIDNLTNGKGTYAETIINGGTVKSTYRAIRQFLNGIEAQNILTVNGGRIEGTNKSIWMQDPSKNANTGTLIVNANANLYGDVYLSVTEGSTEWPVEVAIVADAIKQGTVLTSNVPEGYLLVAENGLYTVETIKVKEQTINLNNGWTWVSLFVDATGESGLESFENQLEQYNTDNQIVQIKNQTKAVTYQSYYGNYGWYGNLKSLAVNDMYMVKIEKANVVVELEDYKVNPADYEFNLVSGWTWLGFPSTSDAPVAIEYALQNITPNKGDQIKSQEGFATYTNNKWYGNLSSMTPGMGYMYKNNSDNTVTLKYPAEVNYRGVAPANITAKNNLMVPNMSKYANNMSIIAVVNIDGEELMTEDFEVAVFAGEELRGSARPIYVEDFNSYMLFLTVYGEASEELTFKYYDLNSGEELNLFADSKVVFEINSTVGSLEEALVLNYGTLSIDETSLNGFNVYPNPVNRDNAISFETTFDKVEVYNSLGVVVAEYANVDQIDGIDAAGIYVIKVTNDNVVKYCRVIVK